MITKHSNLSALGLFLGHGLWLFEDLRIKKKEFFSFPLFFQEKLDLEIMLWRHKNQNKNVNTESKNKSWNWIS